MLFNWDTINMCIIFRSWQVHSNLGLFFWLVAVAAMTAGYELVRDLARRYEASTNAQLTREPSKSISLS
jgi:copper transporter 1